MSQKRKKDEGPSQPRLFAIPHIKAVSVNEAEVFDRVCASPEDAVRIWNDCIVKEPLYDPDKEVFAVLLLNRKNWLKSYHVATIGTLSSALVHPREVLRPAIAHAASAILAIHNHPSGDPSPSSADIQVTRMIREGSRTLGIDFHDHVIVGDLRRDPNGLGHYSFRNAGLI